LWPKQKNEEKGAKREEGRPAFAPKTSPSFKLPKKLTYQKLEINV